MSSYSYQELAAQVASLTDKVNWLLNQFKVQKMTQTATLGPDGLPAVKIESQTLAEVYRDIKNGTIEQVEIK